MVENFGSYLKHERELRGVPLEEISGTTKIHIRFLQALEENKFEDLPGEVFIKGYIRSYADTIGSDVEEMLNIYEESVGNKKIEDIEESISKSNISAKTFLGFAVVGLIIIALIFGAKFFVSSKNSSPPKITKLKENPKTSSSPPPSVKAPEMDQVAEKESPSKVEENSQVKEIEKENLSAPDVSISEEPQIKEKESDSINQQPDVENQVDSSVSKEEVNPIDLEKSMKLTIKVKNNSWFNMTIDDFREEDFILPAGEEKSYWGNEVFRLTIGNKDGTEIFLNGKKLDVPESKENVVKDFIINPKLIE